VPAASTVLAGAFVFTETFSAGALPLIWRGRSGRLAQDNPPLRGPLLDGLVGRRPEAKALYEQRSPLLHADAMHCPVIFSRVFKAPWCTGSDREDAWH